MRILNSLLALSLLLNPLLGYAIEKVEGGDVELARHDKRASSAANSKTTSSANKEKTLPSKEPKDFVDFSEDPRLQRTLDIGLQDDFVNPWLQNLVMNYVRHPLEAAVLQKIYSHKIGQKVMSALRSQNAARMELTRIHYRSNYVQASAGQYGQYAEILQLVKDAMKYTFIPMNARKNLNVIIAGGTEINAFTFTPDISHGLDVVFYTPLIELMLNDDNFKSILNDYESVGPVPLEKRKAKKEAAVKRFAAVINHEFTHVLGGHVLTSMAVTQIFKMTGEILIPGAEAKLNFNKSLRAKFVNSLANLHNVANHSNSQAMMAHIGDYTAAWNSLDKTTASLKAEFSPQEIREFGLELNKVFHNVTEAKANVDGPKPSQEELLIKLYESAMITLTRSQEITADRLPLILLGPKPVLDAMARLAGGPGVNPEAMLRQSEKMIKDLYNLGATTALIENGDHPSLIFRTSYHASWQEHPIYHTLSNDFLRMFDIYIHLSNDLASLQRSIEASKGDMGHVESTRIQRDALKRFAEQIKNTLVHVLIDELKHAEKIMSKRNKAFSQEEFAKYYLKSFMAMLHYMDRSINYPYDYIPDQNAADLANLYKRNLIALSNPDIAKPGRVFYDLVNELKKINSPLGNIMLPAITDRISLYSPLENFYAFRNKVGDLYVNYPTKNPASTSANKNSGKASICKGSFVIDYSSGKYKY